MCFAFYYHSHSYLDGCPVVKSSDVRLMYIIIIVVLIIIIMIIIFVMNVYICMLCGHVAYVFTAATRVLFEHSIYLTKIIIYDSYYLPSCVQIGIDYYPNISHSGILLSSIFLVGS